MPKTSWKVPLFAGALLFIPVFEIIRWIEVAGRVKGGQSEKVAAYLAPYPEFLQSATISTLILFVLSIAAVAVSFRGIDMSGLSRFVCLIELGIGSVLAAWLLFTLM